MNWDLGLFETTVGTSAYQSGHRFPSCAEYIAANPSPENNDGTELWVGAMIADEDIPRIDNTLVDNRTAVAWEDPLADDDGYSGDNAYSCLHSRVYAVAEEVSRRWRSVYARRDRRTVVLQGRDTHRSFGPAQSAPSTPLFQHPVGTATSDGLGRGSYGQ